MLHCAEVRTRTHQYFLIPAAVTVTYAICLYPVQPCFPDNQLEEENFMRKDSRTVIAAALFLIAALIAVFASSACSDEPENTLPPVASGTVVITPGSSIPTNADPSIVGYITRITYAAEYTEILVEYFPENNDEPEFSYSKVLVKLDDKSAIAFGKNNEPYTRTSLAVGSEVEVWFSDPTAESYPVIAYGQAVRVLTSPTSMTELRSLPHLSVSSGSTCATVVTKADWHNKQLDYRFLDDVLNEVSGAHMSAAPGDIITLKFSLAPRTVNATWSTASYATGKQIEITDSKITVPADASGEIFVRIDAEWISGSAQYAFSITVQDNTEQ